MVVSKGCFAELARSGDVIKVVVTPRSSRNDVIVVDEVLRIHVTVAPEGGKANKAVAKLLARALGVAASRLTLLRGQTARTKMFRLD